MIALLLFGYNGELGPGDVTYGIDCSCFACTGSVLLAMLFESVDEAFKNKLVSTNSLSLAIEDWLFLVRKI